MICPYCQHGETKVLDSRDSENAVRRRRECLQCKRRFTSYEKAAVELMVVKKDKRRELFDREKLLRGIMKACEKRPIEREKIESLVDEIELELRNKDTMEIQSNEIGEVIMSKLKQLDKIAYIRFASVYRDFTDVSQFKKELGALLKA